MTLYTQETQNNGTQLASYSASGNSGYNAVAFEVSTGHPMIGKTIDYVEFLVGIVAGSPPGSMSYVKWNSSFSVEETLGSVSSLNTNLSATPAWVRVTPSSDYVIAEGDHIGVVYNEGEQDVDSITVRGVWYDADSDTVMKRKSGSWITTSTKDLCFKIDAHDATTQNQELKIMFYPDNNVDDIESEGGGGGSSSATWKWWLGMRFGTRKRYGTNHIRKMRI